MSGDETRYDPADPQADHFRPPSIPTLVWCMHCHEEYDSWKMYYDISTDNDGRESGVWRCGISGCDGVGFGFDIYPVDPDYVDPDGRDMGEWCADETPEPDEAWDRPPEKPTPVRCEQCGKQYSSADMVWWVDEDCPPDAFQDYGWRCPTEGCWGMGFGEDVRPTDPDYVDELGRRILRPGEKPTPLTPDENDDDIPF